jgi:ABC transporter substrate binding protein
MSTIHRRGILLLLVVLPDGSRSLIPANWTNWESAGDGPSASIPPRRRAPQASRSVPIVFVQVTDPVAFGLVASLARPDGNATGFTTFDHSFSAKWVERSKRVPVTLPGAW